MLPATAAQVHDEYIVVLKPTSRPVADVASDLANTHSGQIGFVYESALQGFTLRIPQAAANGLARNPNVAYVEPVQEVEAVSTQQTPTGIDRIDADLNPPTGPMDVQIAILDTGVYIGTREDGSARSHLDLNLKWVSDCTGAILYPLVPGGCTGSGDFQDRHGHGTHVAGIAAAYDNDIGTVGVAPGATLWSFKVLNDDGTGTTGMILAGIDAVASKADQIDVANMSLGFVGSSQAIDDALASAKAAGVVFVVAAGNDGIDASQFTPASSPDVVAVSALSDFDGIPGGLGEPTCRNDVEDDKLATWSNFGPAVEIAAPGVCILSAGLDDGTEIKSGTSMASPYVAGAMARYIAETGAPTNNASDVDNIVSAVIGDAQPQASACGFTGKANSPEPLLFLNGPAYGGDGTCGTGEEPTNNQPTADFSYVCTDLSCDFTDLSTDTDGTVDSWNWDFEGTGTSEVQHPTHTFPADGTYTVTLTVTDDLDATGMSSQDVTVSGPMVNNPPTASFTSLCTDLSCEFTNTSSDPDGNPLTYVWTFGDGDTSTDVSPTHVYASGGTYPVTLTADDGDLDDTANETVSPADPPPPPPPADPTVTAAVAPFSFDGTFGYVSMVVMDDSFQLVGGATVEGEWTYVDKRGRTRTTTSSTVSADEFDLGTNPTGNAFITKRLPKGSTPIEFCITSVSAPGYDYMPPNDPCVPEADEAAASATTVVVRSGWRAA
jgi:subtilisin family serine protease